MNRFFPSMFGLGAIAILQKVLAFLVATQAVAILSASDFGTYAYVLNAVGLLAMVVILGFPQLLTREIAVYAARREFGLMAGLVRFAMMLTAVICLVVLVVAQQTCNAFCPDAPSELRASVWVALVLLPILTLIGLQQAALRGLGRVIDAVWPVMLLQPAFLLVVLFVARIMQWQAQTHHLLLALVVTNIAVVVCFSVMFLRSDLTKKVAGTKPDYARRNWTASLVPFFFIGGLSVLMNRTDILILGLYQPVEQVGYYFIAAQLAALIGLPLLIINATMEPHIAAAYARQEFQEMKDRFAWLSLWSGALAMIAVFAVWLLGDWVLRQFFGQEFGVAFDALIILSIGSAINVAMGPLGSFLSMAGHERYTLFSAAFGTGMNVVLNFLLIPVYGIEGAALGTTLSIFVSKAINAFFVFRFLGILPGPLGLLVRQNPSKQTLIRNEDDQ